MSAKPSKVLFFFLLGAWWSFALLQAQEERMPVPRLILPPPPPTAQATPLRPPTNTVYRLPVPSPKPFPSRLSQRLVLPARFFSEVLLTYSLETLLENYFEYSIPQLPAAGSYSDPDNFVFSFLGNSWLWNKYSYNGININDPFFEGRTLHKINPLGAEVRLDALTGELALHSILARELYYTELNVGYLFGALPYYRLGDIPMHKAAQKRTDIFPDTRRRTAAAGSFYHRELLLFPSHALWVDVFLSIRLRSYLNFDETGYQGAGYETAYRFSLVGELEERSSRERRWGFLLTYENRDRLFSEFYFPVTETASLSKFALSGFYKHSKTLSLAGSHALHLGTKTISPYRKDRTQNIFNPTGEGLEPNYPGIYTLELSQSSTLSYPLTFPGLAPRFLDFKAHFNNAWLHVFPQAEENQAAVFYKTRVLGEYRALYVTRYESRYFSYGLFDESLSLEVNQLSDRSFFKVDGKIGVDLKALAVSRNSFFVLPPHFELGMDFIHTPKHHLRLAVGRYNTPLGSVAALFLSDAYHSGKSYSWDDKNNDQSAQPEEITSKLHSTTGGAYHSISPNFSAPHYYYLDLPYNAQFTQEWSLGVGLHYRLFKALPWVQYDGAETQYGRYQTIDGQQIFFTHNGEKRYRLGNMPTSRFPANANFFNNSPFYLGGTIKVVGETKHYRLELAFTAYLINAALTRGNGPLHNSLGLISELQADPNARYQGIGRSDADRSYKGKLLFSYRFPQKLTTTMLLKYRDGQPMGAWSAYFNEDGQVAFRREAVSGDNILLYGGEMGLREDAMLSLDVALAKEWEIFSGALLLTVGVYNLFDLGLEILEYTLYKEEIEKRTPLELSVPRGFTAALRYAF